MGNMDYLLEGLEDMEKNALDMTFAGDPGEVWKVVEGEEGGMIQRPTNPFGDLEQRIREHKSEEEGIADELMSNALEVQRFQDELDGCECEEPLMAKKAKNGRTEKITQELPAVSISDEVSDIGSGAIASHFMNNPSLNDIIVASPEGLFEVIKPSKGEGGKTTVVPIRTETDYSSGEQVNIDDFENGLSHPWSIMGGVGRTACKMGWVPWIITVARWMKASPGKNPVDDFYNVVKGVYTRLGCVKSNAGFTREALNFRKLSMQKIERASKLCFESLSGRDRVRLAEFYDKLGKASDRDYFGEETGKLYVEAGHTISEEVLLDMSASGEYMRGVNWKNGCVPFNVLLRQAGIPIFCTIKKEDGKWVVYPEGGGKRLGTHDTKEDAIKQLRAIEVSKNASLTWRSVNSMSTPSTRVYQFKNKDLVFRKTKHYDKQGGSDWLLEVKEPGKGSFRTVGSYGSEQRVDKAVNRVIDWQSDLPHMGSKLASFRKLSVKPGDVVALKPEYSKRGTVTQMNHWGDAMVHWQDGLLQHVNPELLTIVARKYVVSSEKKACQELLTQSSDYSEYIEDLEERIDELNEDKEGLQQEVADAAQEVVEQIDSFVGDTHVARLKRLGKFEDMEGDVLEVGDSVLDYHTPDHLEGEVTDLYEEHSGEWAMVDVGYYRDEAETNELDKLP